MKRLWPIRELGDVCRVVGGGTPAKDNEGFYKGSIPWATVRDMSKDVISETEFKITQQAISFSSTNLIPENNVVIATRVGLGKVCFIERDTAINQDLRGIIPIKPNELSSRFLFWWFKSVAHIIQKEGTGATVQGVKLPFIKGLKIPLPPLPEQRRIVDILDEASERIAVAIANAQKNVANTRELFESYVKDIFTQPDNGWISKKLCEICDKITDGTHQTPEYFDSGFIFLSSKNVTNGILDWENIKYIDECQHQKMQKRLAPRVNDILLRKNGAGYGKAALVDRDVIFDVYVSLAVLRPLPLISPKYLLHFVNSSIVMRQFDDRIKGAGVPNLHLEEIREVIISFPKKIEDQHKIVARLECLLAETSQLESLYETKKSSLEDLKQSLLQKAFSGELTVNTTSLPEAAE